MHDQERASNTSLVGIVLDHEQCATVRYGFDLLGRVLIDVNKNEAGLIRIFEIELATHLLLIEIDD
jgi:hypothetical protein